MLFFYVVANLLKPHRNHHYDFKESQLVRTEAANKSCVSEFWSTRTYCGNVYVTQHCKIIYFAQLSKTILQGTVQGKRRRGRQKKKWTDNIAEWTGKSFAATQALAHNRQRWSQLVQRSSLQRPYDPGGLRDQWTVNSEQWTDKTLRSMSLVKIVDDRLPPSQGSNLQNECFPISCLVSVCPLVALSKAAYAEN